MIWKKEFRYSQNISLYLHLFQQKRLILCCWLSTIFGRKNCWKISVWLQKLCIFRVFFLRMAKVMQFLSAINNCTYNGAFDGEFAGRNTESLGSECLLMRGNEAGWGWGPALAVILEAEGSSPHSALLVPAEDHRPFVSAWLVANTTHPHQHMSSTVVSFN